MQHRRYQKRAGWLALLALALQLVVSFGHHHDHAGHERTAASSAQCVAATGDACAAPADTDDDKDGCAICWAMALVAATVLPFVIGWLIATLRLDTVGLPSSDTHVSFGIAAAFRARGPPVLSL